MTRKKEVGQLLKNGSHRFSRALGKKRIAVTLSARIERKQLEEFGELFNVLVDSKWLGITISRRDRIRIDNLPFEMRQKMIKHDLIEASPDEFVPTLSVLLDRFHASKTGVKFTTQQVYKRKFHYLEEHFGKDTRIDKITPADAESIKDYLANRRTLGRGKLNPTSLNKAIKDFKQIFNFAVNCGYLSKSPFENVKNGKVSHSERQFYVSKELIDSAIEACGDNLEFRALLACARFAGLRIPPEICDLRFSDFDFSVGIFTVPNSGKTGTRRVPIFDELKPFILALQKEDKEFVFERYRKHTNIGTMIKKRLLKCGIEVWEKFFVNLRSSCISDKERLGWKDSVMNAVFGNSQKVRLVHHIQPLPDDEYAKLGQIFKPSSDVPNKISTTSFSYNFSLVSGYNLNSVNLL
jgi:integrase